jgi:pilus assembly protein CpaB
MGRLRGFLWLMAGLVVALMAGVVAFATLSQAADPPETRQSDEARITVVVASRPVAVRSALTSEDLAFVEVPADSVPEGAVRELEAALGKLVLVDLYPGEMLLRQRLLDPNVVTADGRSALVLVEDQVLMAIPAQDLLSRVGVLKAGDQVDLLFSLDFPVDRDTQSGSSGNDDEEQATFSLLENVTVAALLSNQATADKAKESAEGKPAQPQAILLTINPQDALAVKYMVDAGGTFDLVLRAPGVDRLFETSPVDVDYLINRYKIPTATGR